MRSKHYFRLEHHRRGRHALLGAVVDQQVQTYLTCVGVYVLSTVTLLWRLHVASGKPLCSQLHELGRGWAKSSMQRMGFVVRKATKAAKKLPPNSEELKESYDIFGGGGGIPADF